MSYVNKNLKWEVVDFKDTLKCIEKEKINQAEATEERENLLNIVIDDKGHIQKKK